MNIKNININNFDKHKELYTKNIKKSPSLFKKLEFITDYGKSISFNQLKKYSDTVDRYATLDTFLKFISDIDKIIDIEAGIFEYSLSYTIMNNYSFNLFSAIYNDVKINILSHIDNESPVYNQDLLDDIINDKISCQHLGLAGPQELHPKRWEREKRKKEYSDYKKNNMASTDQYKCFKCGESKCKMTQMQTRSADEPITTFIICLVCHNTWRR